MKEDVMRDIDVVVRGMETIAEDTARELAETPKWRVFRRRKLKKRIEEATRNMVLFTLLKGELRGKEREGREVV